MFFRRVTTDTPKYTPTHAPTRHYWHRQSETQYSEMLLQVDSNRKQTLLLFIWPYHVINSDECIPLFVGWEVTGRSAYSPNAQQWASRKERSGSDVSMNLELETEKARIFPAGKCTVPLVKTYFNWNHKRQKDRQKEQKKNPENKMN